MSLPWLEPHQQRLGAAVAANQLGHAPMLLGSRGVGKRALAEWLVRMLLCNAAGSDAPPCGRCRACRAIADRLLNIAITMLRNRTLYDPSFLAQPAAAA